MRPTSEDDDLVAKREALLRPRVVREFLQRYHNAPIPKDTIAQNVLEEMGVPADRTVDVLALILEGAEGVGFLQTIKDRRYVDLGSTKLPTDEEEDKGKKGKTEMGMRRQSPLVRLPRCHSQRCCPASTTTPDGRARRVFITHGKNRAFIEPIKKLLAFGEMEAVVAVQTQTVSQPVSEKVMGDMRSCGAAIIHVEDERHLGDKEGNEHIVLNDNVLIEIGAAMALVRASASSWSCTKG